MTTKTHDDPTTWPESLDPEKRTPAELAQAARHHTRMAGLAISAISKRCAITIGGDMKGPMPAELRELDFYEALFFTNERSRQAVRALQRLLLPNLIGLITAKHPELMGPLADAASIGATAGSACDCPDCVADPSPPGPPLRPILSLDEITAQPGVRVDVADPAPLFGTMGGGTPTRGRS